MSPKKVGSADDGRTLARAAASRDTSWMGQPPATRGDRVLSGGKPRPQGATERAAGTVDRQPTPPSGGQGPATRSPDPEAGGDDCDARHDFTVAPAADCAEVDIRAEAARASGDYEGDLSAHRANGHREPPVGLQPDPGRVEEPRPLRRAKHCRQGAEGPRDSAGAGATLVLAYLSAVALGRDRQRGLLRRDSEASSKRRGCV